MTEAILFVSNGHGEAAIAERIARAVRERAPLRTEHLALVGVGGDGSEFRNVGPQRRMPSGGLVAMGNLPNLARDLRAGLAALVAAQVRFLSASGRRYRCVVAVGDVYGLALALFARRPVVYVGTAKSVYVAPYGPLERFLLRRAAAVFVRDAATAEALRARRIPAQAANVIADLPVDGVEPAFGWERSERLALLPGSREDAYRDGLGLAAVVRRLAATRPGVEAALSIAPGLSAQRFADAFRREGWEVTESRATGAPFVARQGPALVRASAHPFAALLHGATVVVGQAGTANEAAASAGIPVVALERRTGRRDGWYRMRQRRLLGEALAIVSDADAPAFVAQLLDDPERRARMGAAGRERMGKPGASARIAAAVVQCG